MHRLLALVRPAFTLEKTVCRVAAVWLCTAAALLLFRGESFAALSFAQSTSLLPILLGALLFFALLSLAAARFPELLIDSWALFLGATLCLFRWTGDFAGDKPLFLLAVMLFWCLTVFYCFIKNEALLSRFELNGRAVWVMAVLLGVFCAAVIAVITCLRYLSFSSPNFDFGLFVNMFHNMRQGGLPLVTSERDVAMSHFAVHLSPIYYLILPFYALFPSPLTLQIAEAVILGSGVIPVLLLARQLRLSGKAALLSVMLYALYPALSTGTFYDLHENCFLAPLLLWVFYFFEREKRIPLFCFAVLVLAVKEDAAIYLLIFAIYAMLGRRRWLDGGILALGSLLYFGAALAILEASSGHYAALYAAASPNPPIAGPMINRFDNLIYGADAGILGALKTAFLNPGYLLTQLFTASGGGYGKLVYLLQMLLPLGLLPFCTKKPSRWLLASPLLLNLLTAYPYQYDIGFQYHFGITAFLIYGVLLNLPELKAPARARILSLAAAASLSAYLVLVTPSLGFYTEYYADGKDGYSRMEQTLAQIPKDASVAASTCLVAHLADRSEIYETHYHGYTDDTDYVVLDLRFSSEGSKRAAYLRLGYRVVEEQEGLLLVLAKAPTAP